MSKAKQQRRQESRRGSQPAPSRPVETAESFPLGELLASADRPPPPEVEAVLEKLDTTDAQIVRTAFLSQSFSGPLPPPELLKGYAEIIPDGANRIMTMAENEQGLRKDVVLRAQTNEDKIVDNDIVMSRRGQMFGFVGLVGLLAASVVFAFLEMHALSVGTVIGTVGTYAVNMIQARTIAREVAKEAAKQQG